MKGTGTSSRTAILAICLFGLIWGAKAGIVDRYGSDIPNWDQWDAVGDQVFLPYLRGELTPAHFFRPHNEHRIALTRMLGLGLLVLNGQWDSRLECAVNAAIHAFFALGWFLFGRRLLSGRWRLAWLVTVAALIAPPHAWQNITGGFHSQQYLLLGLSTFAVGLLLMCEPWSPGWWSGVACAVLALFTMASGFLAAAAILVSCGVAACRHRHLLANYFPTLVVCVLVAAAGIVLHEPFSGHENLKASSAAEFFLTFWRSLQWPVTMLPLFPLMAWLPFAGLVFQQFRREEPPGRREFVVFTTGVWVLLQFAATAYARGSDAPFPSSRYLDTSLFGIGVVALSGFLLMSNYPVAERFRVARACTLGVWVGSMTLGLWINLDSVISNTLPSLAASMHHQEANTRAYIWTGDVSYLSGRSIPYPDAETLIDRLEPEEIRGILPASIRPPEKLSGDAMPPEAFATGAIPGSMAAFPAEKAWGSFGALGAAATGVWTSQPFKNNRSRWLRFDIAGFSKNGRVSFAVIPAEGDQARRFFPTDLMPGRWNPVYVPASQGTLTVVADDSDGEGWIGFTPPTEMASLSYWTASTCRQGFKVALLAAVGAALCLTIGTNERKNT